MNNQEFKARPKIIDLNSNEPVFYPYCIKVNKCSASCSNINDPFAKLCVPYIIKNINVKVFNLMSRINETRQIIWHETCKCICRLTSAVCNSRQIWNENKCRCECKEDFLWNPSNCAWECGKSCGIGQYLDYKSCVCRNSLVDKLIEECTSVIDGDKIYNKALTVTSSNDCALCTTYVILFIYKYNNLRCFFFHWYKKLDLKKMFLMLTIQRLKH